MNDGKRGYETGRTGGFQRAKLYNGNGSSVFCLYKYNYSKNTDMENWQNGNAPGC